MGALAVISEIDDATFVDGDGVKDEGIERLQDTADKVGECLNDLSDRYSGDCGNKECTAHSGW